MTTLEKRDWAGYDKCIEAPKWVAGRGRVRGGDRGVEMVGAPGGGWEIWLGGVERWGWKVGGKGCEVVGAGGDVARGVVERDEDEGMCEVGEDMKSVMARKSGRWGWNDGGEKEGGGGGGGELKGR